MELMTDPIPCVNAARRDAAATPPAAWPLELRDNHEIANYIAEHASDYVDVDVMRDYFAGARAVLRWVRVDFLKEGTANGNVRSKTKEARYLKLAPATMPPLVAEYDRVEDGNHRLRVCRKLGLTEVLVYQVRDVGAPDSDYDNECMRAP